jgi:hypothetical protein
MARMSVVISEALLRRRSREISRVWIGTMVSTTTSVLMDADLLRILDEMLLVFMVEGFVFVEARQRDGLALIKGEDL